MIYKLTNLTRKTIYTGLLSVLCGLMSPSSHAQLRVEISGVGSNQYPIAIPLLAGNNTISTQVTEVIRNDLSNSGFFKVITSNEAISEKDGVSFSSWQRQGANHVTAGSIANTADQRLQARYRLFSTVRQAELDNAQFTFAPSQYRLTGHMLADRIYEKVTGIPGAFATRIAYVIKRGSLFDLQIADADGQNPEIILRSKEPIISPAWSPDGSKIAYVSFESRKPVVFVHDIASGKRTPVANFKGNNSSPAWSPDGSKLAVVLSKEGGSQIYLINSNGSGIRRLMSSNSIDTEPAFAPNGSQIYFTSDRGGGPQIYRVNLDGSGQERVTYAGDYNTSPNVSADGQYLSFVTRQGGQFNIAIKNLTSGDQMVLTQGSKDQSPSFAPNSQTILYSSRQGGRDVLATVSRDGRIKQTLSSNLGTVTEPVWGPRLLK